MLDRLSSPKQEWHQSIKFTHYIQYQLHRQLLAVSNYAKSKGVALKGDLPIGKPLKIFVNIVLLLVPYWRSSLNSAVRKIKASVKMFFFLILKRISNDHVNGTRLCFLNIFPPGYYQNQAHFLYKSFQCLTLDFLTSVPDSFFLQIAVWMWQQNLTLPLSRLTTHCNKILIQKSQI